MSVRKQISVYLTKTLHVAAGLSELKKNNTDIQNKNKKYYARQRAYEG